jgi:cytochrome c-type biogenesis protein CcmE
VNRQARRRLLIAVIVIVVAFAAGVFWLVRSQGAYYRQVGDLTTAGLDGKTVKVGGTIQPGSLWRGDSGGGGFTIKDLTGKSDEVLVKYAGSVPSTLGAGVQVVILGTYHGGSRGGTIDASEVQTKCPSKYKDKASPAATPASQ